MQLTAWRKKKHWFLLSWSLGSKDSIANISAFLWEFLERKKTFFSSWHHKDINVMPKVNWRSNLLKTILFPKPEYINLESVIATYVDLIHELDFRIVARICSLSCYKSVFCFVFVSLPKFTSRKFEHKDKRHFCIIRSWAFYIIWKISLIHTIFFFIFTLTSLSFLLSKRIVKKKYFVSFILATKVK